jgi:glycine cleavage system aminomethyltransferase T/glycine/D-amino acid oxidase-like deaminating enzyme
MTLPERSQVVIIGGGVVGCSIAYHLAQRGLVDVVLVERKTLTSGSTWHAAGLVGQLRSSSNLTKLMQKSVETYQQLEKKTGYATGWRGVGSVRVASSPDRWEELKRVATTGKSFGFNVELISAREAKDLFPLLNTEGVYGATWVPSDGYADPSQLTHSFATGARDAGVKIIQNCRVETIERTGRRVTAVITEHGRIACDVVVNATGMWGTETAKLAAVDLAVSAVEHQYVVTQKSDAIPADLPTFRDPDARFYLKPDAGALVVGGWEDGTRVPWHRIPVDLGAVLFPPNHERFQMIAEQAANRIPIFGDLGIQSWINGPIPFSPDAEPLMGITEDLDNLFHCCGFSAGIAAAGGAGYAMANWILDGDPGMDLWPFDVRRFGKSHNVPAYLEQRSIDAYSHYYQIAYPNRELAGPRKQRVSALYGALESRGAVFGSKFGWERANWFVTDGSLPAETPSFGRTNAFAAIAAEHHAVRSAVGIVDQSSFSKYEISGMGALALLQKVAGADIDVPAGKIVYTQLLNIRGGIEADVTITRLGAELFYLVTGSAFGRHDLTFLLAHAPQDGSVTVRAVTSAFGVLNLCGPRSRELAQILSGTSMSNSDFPYMSAQNIDLGFAPALALRATYVGELGWEFHIPTEFMLGVYEHLMLVGEEFGIRNVGYRTIESLRLEKQYLAWASDIRSDNNPFEAGLGFTVKADKPGLLAGPALRKIRENGVKQTLCWLTADPEVVMHGDELLTHEHEVLATTVKSAGYGHTVGRTIFSAYLPIALARETDFVVDVATKRFPAVRHDQPLYDPKGVRIRA